MKIDFDINEIEDAEYEVLPKGIYTLILTEEELAENKAGTGDNLKLVFEVVGSEGTGSKIFEYWPVRHEKPNVVSMTQRKIRDLCLACGRPGASDTQELQAVPFKALVVVQEGKGQYGPSNKIKKFVPAEDGIEEKTEQKIEEKAEENWPF